MLAVKDAVCEQVYAVRGLLRNPRLFAFSVVNLAMIVFSALMLWKFLMAMTNSDSPVVVVLSGSMEPAFQRGDILFLDNTNDNVFVGDIVVFKITGAYGCAVAAFVRIAVARRSGTGWPPPARETKRCKGPPVSLRRLDTPLLAARKAYCLIICRSFLSAPPPPSRSTKSGRDVPIVHRVLKVHQHANATGDGSVDFLTKGDNNPIDDRNLYATGQLWLKRSEIIGKAVAEVPYVGMVTILLNDYPALKYVLIGLMGLFVLTTREG